MNATNIEWCDFSSNPLKYRDAAGNQVWACVKKSTGCANCYSEAVAQRFNRGGPFTLAVMKTVKPYLDAAEIKQIVSSKKIRGKRVFLGDMTDLFGDWVPDEVLDGIFAAMACRLDVTFQVLTKRPERMREYLERRSKLAQPWKDAARKFGYSLEFERFSLVPFPLPNLWVGTSTENQATADERIPELLKIPAAVRFLSCEPLLGPVRLDEMLVPFGRTQAVICPLSGEWVPAEKPPYAGLVDWVIVGGESGPQARRCHLEWMRSIIRQCRETDTPVFVKQLGRHPYTLICKTPDCSDDACRNYLDLKDPKGGDMDEWPADLRIRQFPAVEAAT